MIEQLKFEVGKCYRTRDGKKATVLLIREKYMVGEIKALSDNPYIWNIGGGWHPEAVPYSCDLVAEWREPARVTVGLMRRTANDELGLIEIDSETYLEWKRENGWELIARHEIVEGEGLT